MLWWKNKTMQAKFKGLLKKVDCQTPTTKLTIEVDTEKAETIAFELCHFIADTIEGAK